MNLSAEQLAELLAGIAKSQNAIIDAVERANGGWRNNHMSPMLNVAANMRIAEPRLIDLPARILMRYQGRPAVDIAAIAADLERLIAGAAPVAGPTVAAATPTPVATPAPAMPANIAAVAAAAAAALPAAAPEPTASAPAAPLSADDMDFIKGA